MHLKTLTLRGFKSFASATTLHFEPGVTCVVGPNGSGKSNVVDALAWVMGEQGAKSLRGGKMEDVIFAGTAGRPPLGRAEVALTIDNSDGVLPIEYSEVTISRTLFRSGGSEYAINGSQCRLLDIQELLSDTGMGREMHVIVGQGQLDTVLRADPAERRGFIEEAAGVLKHRRRKEKAVRKLDATQANITRLVDLTTELRRQLGPLGRQAEVARKAATIQIDVRDARARLLADDIASLRAAADAERADADLLASQRAELQASVDALAAQVVDLEAAAIRSAPALAQAQDTWYRLTATRDRLRATGMLAAERQRGLAAVPTYAGADPDDLESQARRVRASQAELTAEVTAARTGLDEAVGVRTAAEQASHAAERLLADLQRAAADQRESVATLKGKLAAQQSRQEASEAEIARLRTRLADAESRAGHATAEFTDLETHVAGAEQGEVGLDAAHERAVDALDTAQAALTSLAARTTDAERERATWAARLETLQMSLVPTDGAAALLSSQATATLGSLAAHLSVEPGYEAAIAAALGPYADAVAVASVADAVDALRYLRDDDAGRVALVVAGSGPATDEADVPPGVTAATDVATASSDLGTTMTHLLAGVAVTDDLAAARALLESHPDLVVVTKAGDVLSTRTARGGSAAAPSSLHLQAAVDDARGKLDAAIATLDRLAFDSSRAQADVGRAQATYDATLEALNESDATLAAVTEQLGHLGAVARAAVAEADRHRQAIAQAEAARAEAETRAGELTALLAASSDDPAASAEALAVAGSERQRTANDANAARAAETEIRLRLRTAEERERALAGRAESLERAAAAERDAIAKAAAAAEMRRVQAARAAEVERLTSRALERIGGVIDAAAAAREELLESSQSGAADLAAARHRHAAAAGDLGKLTDAAHAEELARAQHTMRLDALGERAVEELGMDADTLVAEYGPDVPIPVTGADGEVTHVEFEREAQAKRLARAERDLVTLGRVNPLALEEFAALEERHTYLADQLTDLRASKADLLSLIADIDERVEQVFAEAFADTAAQFEKVFAQLFPGGEGRLLLTEPENLLTTGIEVEARPAGKKVRRLSLLSGGERALTAVALLVAIFRARPSPFYVMDEVEAALDDVNLSRLLTIFADLQTDSQLIVVTHQKQTMEIADALYGVTMRSGVSQVISQRMKDGGS